MKIRDYPLVFTGGDSQKLSVPGDFFAVLEATNPINVFFDEAPAVEREAGQYQEGEYSSIRIESATAQTIKVAAGFGRVINNKQAVAVNVSTNLDPSGVINSHNGVIIPAGATGLVLAGNANRKRAIIQSSFTNDPTIIAIVDGAGITALTGLELTAGAGLPPLETTAAIYVHNPGATPILIKVWEDES